ncbi:MAG: penicillin-binding transpeptidase domain-containing protein, partial [Terrimicrobiaceae bacterium]|nr:penicillin-binding transpeptidase domain-containing protein [Terrimicrobiaceae bacterium]
DETMRKALTLVTQGGQGTGHNAKVKGIEVAGKTGTAQWGPTNRQRTAAWFAGFLPAREPRFAFACVYEADPGVKASGGASAAPIIGKIFRAVYGKNPQAGEGDEPILPDESG